jgi:3-oxoacyl-[acyl-carrier-protein] synthase II
VVLTGIGVVTPLGLDLSSFRQALRDGRGGIRTFRNFDPSGLPVRFGGEIDGFDARDFVDKKDRKQLKLMVRTIQLGVASARRALEEAGLVGTNVDPTRFGVVFGTGIIPGEMAELGAAGKACYDPVRRCIDMEKWGREGIAKIPPMWMLNHVPNMPASHISILNNAQGPNNTITQSDAAGLLALGEAVRVIQRGAADVMLAGGCDTRTNAIQMVRHQLCSQLSHRNDAPETASRPFDRRRDGQVCGEGGSALVVEDSEHARRRGARILAEVAGFSSSFDLGRTGWGLARAVRRALDQAGIGAADLDHVNAHAGGLLEEDAWEARGIREALGGTEVPVLAVKSYVGNLGPGAAVAELAASLVALDEGVRAATLNYEEADPSCPVHVEREPGRVRKPWVLKVSCTERGQCAAVVVRKWE